MGVLFLCESRSVSYQKPQSPSKTLLRVGRSVLSLVGGLSGCALYSGASLLSLPFSLRTFQGFGRRDPSASPLCLRIFCLKGWDWRV